MKRVLALFLLMTIAFSASGTDCNTALQRIDPRLLNSTADIAPFIVELVEIALDASEEIMKIYHSAQIQVDRKLDGSAITNADKNANKVITRRLKNLRASTPIISEESPLPDFEVRRHWKEFFLIDPIDGTNAFIRKSDEFTVNIAYIVNGLPEAGVVVAPAKGVVYFAARGLGTWRQKVGQAPERVLSTAALDRPIVISSNHKNAPEYESFFRSQGISSKDVLGVESSLKFGLVAEGSARAYLRLKGQKEWDVAAGAAIYRFSGPPQNEVLPIPFIFNSKKLKVDAFTVGRLR